VVHLANALDPECSASGCSFADKSEALRTIAELAVNSPVLCRFTVDQVLGLLSEREELLSTGLENGFALPHCRVPGLTGAVAGILTVPDGIEFDAVDGSNTRLMVYIICGTDNPDQHVSLLSAVIRTPVAVEICVQIIRAFVVMRKFLIENGPDVQC